MILNRKFVRISVLAFTLIFTSSMGFANSPVDPGLDHAREIKVRPDGSFDVVCIDGEVEVRSAADVQAGIVCTHINVRVGRWALESGGIESGMRMCDIDMTHTTGKNKILKLEAGFVAPCASERVRSEDCNGLVCSVQLSETFYSFDFSVDGKLKVTRLKDGFSGIFRGSSGVGQISSRVRVARVGGVDNIVQASNDDGATWQSVCDDGFDQNEAQVACREMGRAGLVSVKGSVSVSGDENYGLDDLDCNGSESSLFDCRNSGWAVENCSAFEHVQLVCQ